MPSRDPTDRRSIRLPIISSEKTSQDHHLSGMILPLRLPFYEQGGEKMLDAMLHCILMRSMLHCSSMRFSTGHVPREVCEVMSRCIGSHTRHRGLGFRPPGPGHHAQRARFVRSVAPLETERAARVRFSPGRRAPRLLLVSEDSMTW